MICGNLSTVPPIPLYYFYCVNSLVCTAVNGFALYMMVTQTPKEMKQYKYVLMNITFWAYFVDITGNLFAGPVNMMPLFGGFGIGSLRWMVPGNGYVHILLLLIGTTGCATSIVFGFMYRWWILCFGHWVHQEPYRLPLLGAAPFIVFCSPIAFFQFLMWPTKEETRAYIKKVCPIALPLLERDMYFIVDETDPNLQHLFMVFNIAGVFNVACLTYSLVRIFRKMNSRDSGAMSEKTMKMNRQLTWSLILHTALPGLSYMAPTVLAMAASQMQMTDVQNLMHFLGATFLTHSTWSALTMLVTIGAYRKKILSWSGISKRKTQRSQSMQTAITVRSIALM